MTTESLETAITLAGEETPTETLLELGDKIARLKELIREFDKEWEKRMVARVQRDGAIVDGGTLYRVGTPAETKCADPVKTTEAVLTAVEGDFHRFVGCLSSNAFKYGQCRQLLPPEVFEQCFTTTREPKLQVDEATPRRLQKIQLAFVRPVQAKALTEK